jgi:hypothetical protein
MWGHGLGVKMAIHLKIFLFGAGDTYVAKHIILTAPTPLRAGSS